MKVRLTQPCRFEPFNLAASVGSVIDLPNPQAVELIEMGRAEAIQKAPKKTSPKASPRAERKIQVPKSEKATKK